MLMGELAMVFGRRGVILRVFVFAEVMMMGRLMMMMRGGVVVTGRSVVMLACRMRGRLGHVFALLPKGEQPRSNKPL